MRMFYHGIGYDNITDVTCKKSQHKVGIFVNHHIEDRFPPYQGNK